MLDHSPTLDREVLQGLRDEFGTAMLTSLVAHFCERISLIEAVSRACRTGDGPELARTAHGLRSAASILGATRLAELATELEERGASGHLYGTAIIARETHAEFERALAEMGDALSIEPSPRASLRPWHTTKRSRDACAN